MPKIVTDSVSDLPSNVAKSLDITIIPLNIHFGMDTFRDGIDMDRNEFYSKLQSSSVLPKTSCPSAGIFAETFDRVGEESDEIVAVFLSKKFSTTYNVARQGIELMKRKRRVVVLDSTLGAMGQGLLVIEAAKKALAGASLDEVMEKVVKTIPQIYVRASLCSLKYLAMGGRIGKAQALLAATLRINPILGIKGGEAFPIAKLRSRAKANEWLHKFISGFKNLEALAIEYGTNQDEAKALLKRVSSIFPDIPAYVSQINPVIGTHTGPQSLIVSVLSGESSE
jgi:DegV family protein with EDD domain